MLHVDGGVVLTTDEFPVIEVVRCSQVRQQIDVTQPLKINETNNLDE